MPRPISDIAFSPAVKAIQTENGSRNQYARMENGSGWSNIISPELAQFISDLDMFYLGTTNLELQPYVQYRGGPKGFLKVLDDKTLGFADFTGNRQYISIGNLSENPKAFLFLMDYRNQQRVKIWGRATVVAGDDKLNQSLHVAPYTARVERAILFHIDAWDANCPQHIHQRIPKSVVDRKIADLTAKIRELETELQQLKSSADESN